VAETPWWVSYLAAREPLFPVAATLHALGGSADVASISSCCQHGARPSGGAQLLHGHLTASLPALRSAAAVVAAAQP
jgi:hypothetical protein